eukprot:TRINITY_DN78734_c0_g1_i1.p1 TRINITY_DN78734_c0_g1~~TRINITY_DN78734_c0_g1_i1.p1  ORF type:complete len:459 (+),score=88.92 TRINITY_DN78734_c0_g1_i1:120-1496(+)
MDESQNALGALQAEACAAVAAAERLRQEKAELQATNDRLSRELYDLQSRLDFVEDIVGPTETQRRMFHVQLTAARDAALRVAHDCPNSIQTRCVGRLDERWLRLRGLTDAEISMLQRGCVSGEDGVPCDISVLGDPAFCPYDRETLEPNWEAKGGFLQMSLGDIREKWGEEVALQIMRCAIELDKYDASRRLGVELPWHEDENREMEPAELIGLLGQQLSKSSPGAECFADTGEDDDDDDDEDLEWGGLPRSDTASPEEHTDGNGTSRAWTMLEAMMSDLGLNQATLLTPPLIQSPCEWGGLQRADGGDTDEDVVAEALEEDHQAELQQEHDIQQMLYEPQGVAPGSCPRPQSSTQQKNATSRRLGPSGAQTPCYGTPFATTRSTCGPNSLGLASSSPGGTELASSTEGEAELAMPNEISCNEALLLSLLQDEVTTNMSYYLPTTSDSPSSSADRPTS